MIIVGFTNKTSKILPRILCHKFRHVAPIVMIKKNHFVLYQFVRRKNIAKIPIKTRDIKILGQHGWKFICLTKNPVKNFARQPAWSCVKLVKNSINLRNRRIQTPYALYKKLKNLEL